MRSDWHIAEERLFVEMLFSFFFQDDGDHFASIEKIEGSIQMVSPGKAERERELVW